jgi:hypothetical protein
VISDEPAYSLGKKANALVIVIESFRYKSLRVVRFSGEERKARAGLSFSLTAFAIASILFVFLVMRLVL